MKIYTMKIFAVIIAFAIVAGIAFSSCKKLINSNPSWDVSILAPLLQSTLTLNNLLSDSILETESDNSVSLVFSNELYRSSLSQDVFKIPDTSLTTAFSLQNLNLANRTITTQISLGQMCQQLGSLGTLIILSNGNTMVIPPLTGISTPDNDLDATQFFQSADVESGSIDLTLQNGLPLTMSTMVFQVKNKIDQQIITIDTFTNLLPNQMQTKTIDLSGKHVEGVLSASILDLESPGGTVLIDTSDAITITMKTNQIKVSSATAVFPSQDLINQNNNIVYNLSGGAELNTIHVKSGQLVFEVISTIPQASNFQYSLPYVKDANGNSIIVSHDLPAAPMNGTSSFTQSFDLSNYTFDLTTGNSNVHNTVNSIVIASIDSNGQVVTISKSDSIHINYQLISIVPDYISGYVGQQIVNVNQQNAFSALSKIKGGTLSLENANVNLTIKNGIGVQGRVNIYDLISMNSKTGNQVSLTWDQLGKPLAVSPAIENPFTPSVTSFLLNNTNSNIQTLISNLPDQLKYSLDVFINPNGNSSNYHDFAYDSSALSADLDLTVPLSLVASDLLLMDTLDFSLGTAEPNNAQVKNGTFTLIVSNGFPISAQPQVYFCNDYYEVIDSLFSSPQTAAAAALNDQCLVSAPVNSNLVSVVDDAKMSRIRLATKAVIAAKFNTATHPNCGFIKIYSDYSMNVKLTGLFTYYTGN
ncbi:MAG: hypothetical protein ACHQD9_00655 [Chitinophagales bacterium]